MISKFFCTQFVLINIWVGCIINRKTTVFLWDKISFAITGSNNFSFIFRCPINPFPWQLNKIIVINRSQNFMCDRFGDFNSINAYKLPPVFICTGQKNIYIISIIIRLKKNPLNSKAFQLSFISLCCQSYK